MPETIDETPVTAPVPPLKEVTPVFWMEKILPLVAILMPLDAFSAMVPEILPKVCTTDVANEVRIEVVPLPETTPESVMFWFCVSTATPPWVIVPEALRLPFVKSAPELATLKMLTPFAVLVT